MPDVSEPQGTSGTSGRDVTARPEEVRAQGGHDPALVPGAGTARAPEAVEGKPTLDERLKAAGMFTVPEMMGTTPMTRWEVHSGMTDLDFFGQWLDQKVSEYLRMKAGYDLGDKEKDDELYEWVLAHSAAFAAIRTNFRAALAGDAGGRDPAGGAVHEHAASRSEATPNPDPTQEIALRERIARVLEPGVFAYRDRYHADNPDFRDPYIDAALAKADLILPLLATRVSEARAEVEGLKADLMVSEAYGRASRGICDGLTEALRVSEAALATAHRTLAEQAERIGALEAGLRPFAAYAEHKVFAIVRKRAPDEMIEVSIGGDPAWVGPDATITTGDLRRARALLTPIQETDLGE